MDLEQLLEKAERGDIKAQYELYLYYFLGKTAAEDYKEAVKWCRKAAEQSPFLPPGDQSQAIAALIQNIETGQKMQGLKGECHCKISKSLFHDSLRISLCLSFCLGIFING